jgi:hypothetical protein
MDVLHAMYFQVHGMLKVCGIYRSSWKLKCNGCAVYLRCALSMGKYGKYIHSFSLLFSFSLHKVQQYSQHGSCHGLFVNFLMVLISLYILVVGWNVSLCSSVMSWKLWGRKSRCNCKSYFVKYWSLSFSWNVWNKICTSADVKVVSFKHFFARTFFWGKWTSES